MEKTDSDESIKGASISIDYPTHLSRLLGQQSIRMIGGP